MRSGEMRNFAVFVVVTARAEHIVKYSANIARSHSGIALHEHHAGLAHFHFWERAGASKLGQA